MINREISIMIRIQHPTIIKFFGYSLEDFTGNNNVTILMELSINGSLSDYLDKVKNKQADFDNNTVRQIILIGITRAMMYLHQNHILHRDLKPLNVLLDSDYHPKIIDFGLSKFFEPDKTPNATNNCGTPIYMEPEIISNDLYSEKTDVYAFGILMYEVVTNKIPYPMYQSGKMTYFQFSKKVVEENYRPIFDLPVKKSIQELIEKCWSPNPEKRPSFENLFNKLAYSNKEWIIDIYEGIETENEYEMNKYFLENVDISKIENYVGLITEKKQDKEDKNSINEIKDQLARLAKENEEMKRQIAELKNESKNQQPKFQICDPPQTPNVAEISPRLSLNLDKNCEPSKSKKITVKSESLKVIVVGRPFVGKTSIIKRICFGVFEPEYVSTIGLSYLQYSACYDNKEIIINFWHTAGEEKSRSVSLMYYRNAHVAIIIFDLTNLDSANSIQSYIDDVKSICPDSYILVVANKEDLPNKVVPLDEIRNWCNHKGFGFQAVSAKTGHRINIIVPIILANITFVQIEETEIKLGTTNQKKKKGCC